jgi:1,5-anhydro-D-fructose reductase (1,5-anhydro-D-mannitol-forming)
VIRIGIVGCGWILRSHLAGYKALREAGYDNFRIVALAARKEEDALRYLRRDEGPPPKASILDTKWPDVYNAPPTYVSDVHPDGDAQVYTDFREMIAKADIDAVNDFTSIYVHHEVAEAAMNAGLHFFGQKPPAITVAGSKKLVELAEQTGVVYGIYESVRSATLTRATRWAIDSGLIGEPRMAIRAGVDCRWSPARVVANTPWRCKKLLTAGHAAIDWGVHHFDELRYSLGEADWVSAEVRTFEPLRYLRDIESSVVESVDCEVDDAYFAIVGLKSGTVAHMMWSIAGSGADFRTPGLVIYGNKGCIQGGELIDEGGQRTDLVTSFKAESPKEDLEMFFPDGLQDSASLQQLDWLNAIEQGTLPEVDGQEGLRDLACCFAVLESAHSGRRVTVEDVLSGRESTFQKEIDAYYGF